MGKIKVRWLIRRRDKAGERFYWYPPKEAQRRHGLTPRSLGHNEAEAARRAIELNLAADRRVAEGEPGLPADKLPGTWGWLIDLFEKDSEFLGRRASTQRYYAEECRQVRRLIGDLPLDAVGRIEVKTIFNAIAYDAENPRPRKAEKIVRTIQRLRNFAYDLDPARFGPSPFIRLKLPKREIEKRRWTDSEMEAFCAAATARTARPGKPKPVNRPSIALALRIARFAAMRPGDVLSLTAADLVAPVIDFQTRRELAKVGIRKITGKRLVKIVIPVTDETLAEELLAAQARGGPVVVNETTGERWNQRLFQQTFRAIRKDAGLPEEAVLRTMRHTRLQEAADGGASRDQIRALAGHDNAGSSDAYIWPSAEQALGAIRAADAAVSDRAEPAQANKSRAKLNGSPERS